ncbi:MAG: hypothetical protein ACJARL_003106 [Halopseudomonas sp.]|jgi:hypothetical protein
MTDLPIRRSIDSFFAAWITCHYYGAIFDREPALGAGE